MPLDGSRRPAARSALAKAVGRSEALAMTSPVERISGPSTGSAPGNLANGSTAAFTETCPGDCPSGRSTSDRLAPAARRQAAWTRLTPVALLAYGTVREARGFASSTNNLPSASASWTFRSPTTPSAGPSRSTTPTTWACSFLVSEGAGRTQLESPEWIPASSTCCMIPATQTLSPSDNASTSTSIASSRKRSISTGWAGDTSTAVAMYRSRPSSL